MTKKPKIYLQLQILCRLFNDISPYWIASLVIMCGFASVAGLYGLLRIFHEDPVTYCFFPIVFIDSITISSLAIVLASGVSKMTDFYLKNMEIVKDRVFRKQAVCCKQFGVRLGALRCVQPYYLSEFYVIITNNTIPLLVASQYKYKHK